MLSIRYLYSLKGVLEQFAFCQLLEVRFLVLGSVKLLVEFWSLIRHGFHHWTFFTFINFHFHLFSYSSDGPKRNSIIEHKDEFSWQQNKIRNREKEKNTKVIYLNLKHYLALIISLSFPSCRVPFKFSLCLDHLLSIKVLNVKLAYWVFHWKTLMEWLLGEELKVATGSIQMRFLFFLF